MADASELLIGFTLVIVSIGGWFACLPRRGKTLSFVKKPFVGPAVAVLIICGLALGIIEIMAYFTTIDNLLLSGKRV